MHGMERGPRQGEKETSAVLSSPAALILSSAPFSHTLFTRAIVTADELPYRQVLFGWEAGLRAFAAALRRYGKNLYVTAAPEIFSGESGRRQILLLTGEPSIERVVHLRFGPPIMARLVKPAENWHVLLESSPFSPVIPGDHPLGAEHLLPPAVTKLCAFESPFPPIRRLDGKILEAEELDPALFATRDLEAEEAATLPPHLSFNHGWGPKSGLIAQSFAEFSPSSWEAEPPPTPLRHSDWRGVIAARHVAAERREAQRTFIALPWNLAHPASIVPDLVLKLTRSATLSAHGCHLILLPYNETAETPHVVQTLVEQARAHAADCPRELRHLFLARYRGGPGLHGLKSLIDIVWLEASLPDLAWTARRLEAFSSPFLLLGQSPAASRTVEKAKAVISGDERLEIVTDDAFGRRHFVSMSLSERTVAFLLRETLRCRRPSPPLAFPHSGGAAFAVESQTPLSAPAARETPEESAPREEGMEEKEEEKGLEEQGHDLLPALVQAEASRRPGRMGKSRAKGKAS